MTKERIELGDMVRDPISEVIGIVVADHNYLHGCRRLSIQQKAKEGGSVPDHASFDEPQLEIVKKGAFERGDTVTGGPEKYADR